MSADQLQKVEAIVRAQIEAKHPVHCKVVPLASAMQITSLRAVFGETYPDPVRVVSVGKSVEDLLADPTNPEWQKYSIELCGGTHVPNTSFAEAFVISEESGTAKGIRRQRDPKRPGTGRCHGIGLVELGDGARTARG